jgi:hypothetical protein
MGFLPFSPRSVAAGGNRLGEQHAAVIRGELAGFSLIDKFANA